VRGVPPVRRWLTALGACARGRLFAWTADGRRAGRRAARRKRALVADETDSATDPDVALLPSHPCWTFCPGSSELEPCGSAATPRAFRVQADVREHLPQPLVLGRRRRGGDVRRCSAIASTSCSITRRVGGLNPAAARPAEPSGLSSSTWRRFQASSPEMISSEARCVLHRPCSHDHRVPQPAAPSARGGLPSGRAQRTPSAGPCVCSPSQLPSVPARSHGFTPRRGAVVRLTGCPDGTHSPDRPRHCHPDVRRPVPVHGPSPGRWRPRGPGRSSRTGTMTSSWSRSQRTSGTSTPWCARVR
jgi:hypothetical protein